MPIEFVGRVAKFKGKTLWEIVGNLKNFGVGRLFLCDLNSKYTETCFYQITKVLALDAENTVGKDRKVLVQANSVFRGRPSGIVTFEKKSDMAMFQLVPKLEEAKFLNYKHNTEVNVVPEFLPWPPLLKEVMLRRAKKLNKTLRPITILHTPCDFERIDPNGKPIKPNLAPTPTPVADIIEEIATLLKNKANSADSEENKSEV